VIGNAWAIAYVLICSAEYEVLNHAPIVLLGVAASTDLVSKCGFPYRVQIVPLQWVLVARLY